MNTVVWIVQILLAFAFFIAGIMKMTQPLDKLKENMHWIESINPPNLVRVIGALEALGAVGLILPALTGILPWLTPVAAGGLVLTMIGAMLLHIRRGDPALELVANIVLLAMAAFIVYGRLIAAPLA